MNELNFWKTSTIALLVISAVWVWSSRIPEDSLAESTITAPKINFRAPAISLPNPEGEVVSLSDLRGKAVVLNIWASWCLPCRTEMPALQRIYHEYRSQGIEFLAVNLTYQDSLTDALAFIEEFQLTMPILLDKEGSVSKDYMINSLPTTFFIDSAGFIRDIVVGGPVAEALLRIRIEKLTQAR